MGSASSSGKNHQEIAKYGQICVQTEKAIYYGGETVSGTIYIDLAQDFPGTQLYLKFKGKEDVNYWRSVGSKGHSRLAFRSYKSTFLRELTVVKTWNDRVMRGQYAIPFSFLLPQNLSGSCQQEAHMIFARKFYQVEAYIQPTNPKGLKFKYKQGLVIREPLLKVLQQNTLEVEKNIWNCCCRAGVSKMKVTFNKNVFAPGDTAEISYEFDNSFSKMPCKNIYVYFKQTIILKTENSQNTHEIAFSAQTFPGVAEGSAPIRNTTKITLPPFKRGMDQVDKRELTEDQVRGCHDDPRALSMITTGEHITSKYALEVLAIVGLFNIVRVECPIDLLYPEMQVQKIKAPENWQPQTYESFNFAFPSFQQQQVNQKGNNDMMNNQMQSRTVYPAENAHLLNSPH